RRDRALAVAQERTATRPAKEEARGGTMGYPTLLAFLVAVSGQRAGLARLGARGGDDARAILRIDHHAHNPSAAGIVLDERPGDDTAQPAFLAGGLAAVDRTPARVGRDDGDDLLAACAIGRRAGRNNVVLLCHWYLRSRSSRTGIMATGRLCGVGHDELVLDTPVVRDFLAFVREASAGS